MTALTERARQLHQAALAASDGGRPATAVRQLRAGLRLLAGSAAPEEPSQVELRGRILVSLAWAEAERGRVDAGFQLLAEAESLVAEAERPVLLAQRALLLKRTGRYRTALQTFDQAVAGLDEHQHALDLVKVLNNRSLVRLELGQVRSARADLVRCGELAERHGLPLHVAMSVVNLGCVDIIAGDLPSALHQFARARPLYQRLAPGRLGNLAVYRAQALLAAGLFEEADRELAGAIETATRQQLTFNRAEALHVRAEAALLAGRPAAAAGWARLAEAGFHARDHARWAAVSALLVLRADHAQADPDANAALAARAGPLAGRLRRLGLPEDARVARLVAARALLACGRPGLAGRAADRAGRPGHLDRLDTRLLYRLVRAELASAAGRRAEAARHLRAGLAALHRYQGRFGCLDLQTGAAVHGADLARAGLTGAMVDGTPAAVYRWSERVRAQAMLLPSVNPPDDPAAAAALEELRQARQALREAELAGRPAPGVRGRIEALQRTVREHAWTAAGRPGPVPQIAPMETVRAALRGRALVSYLRVGPALSALVIVEEAGWVVSLGGYAEAAEAVQRLRADLDAQAGRAMPSRLATAVASAAAADADRLATCVLTPLLRHVGDRELVVVPTGALLAVPWSTLPGCAGRAVTVAASATSWQAAQRGGGSSTGGGTGGGGALLVAGPGTQRGTAEVTAIESHRPERTILTGPSATPAATLAALDGAGLAHLAAHGHHQPENPLFSRIELAGGPLFGYDLGRLRRPPRLVVLSCCELGLAEVRPGDEGVGMVTALLTAGSTTVVASVARVADEAAMVAMTGFHEAVAAGAPPAAALAGAGPAAAGFVCFGAG